MYCAYYWDQHFSEHRCRCSVLHASDLWIRIYSSTDGTYSSLLTATMGIISSALSGTYSRSTPIVSADGNYLIYSYYELDPSNPLAEGHVRGSEIDNDPSSATYGQVLYNGSTDFGGALWDGGTLLVSRPVTASEYNEEDRDGFGKRDIYTFFEGGALCCRLK